MHDDDEPFREPNPTFDRPTLLNSCARAATAAEARFRVQYPNALPRASRIVALDRGAARMLDSISEEPWQGARFLTLAAHQPGIAGDAVMLIDPGGAERPYAAELDGADVVVMVATSTEGAAAAAVMGRLARAASVMCAGIVVAGPDADTVIGALRPSAAVLVMASDDDYLPAMLQALRA